MNYKGIDKTKILEVQKVKLINADAYAMFTEAELKEICKATGSFERLNKAIENQLNARKNDTEMAIICEMAMMYLDSLKDKETADMEAYNKGLNDAWELAKKLWLPSNRGGLPSYEVKKIFECDYFEIAENYTPQEALTKLEIYEKQNEIKVGDVVKVEAERCPFVVIAIYANDVWCYRMAEGLRPLQNLSMDMIKKTGKHIDIQKILDELKEGSECHL